MCIFICPPFVVSFFLETKEGRKKRKNDRKKKKKERKTDRKTERKKQRNKERKKETRKQARKKERTNERRIYTIIIHGMKETETMKQRKETSIDRKIARHNES